ncbi:hypothetical protein GQL56_00355 [Pseudomonas putida]|nr:hypothetical protein [Pseudomonas putida]
MQVLSALQRDVEAGGNEAIRAHRRAVLRGMRAALWASEARLPVKQLAQDLRAELFDWPASAYPRPLEPDGVCDDQDGK